MNDPKVVRSHERGGWGCDAVWADDFHHALRVLLTGDRSGYYEEFGEIGDLAKAYRRPHVHDGGYSTFRRRRFGARADDVPPAALRRLRPEPRPGRQPRVRRPPAARGAPARRALHAAVAVHADALPGRGARRARAVPVLRRPHRRGDRRRHARRAAARVRRLRGVRGEEVPDPQDPGDLRALQAHPQRRARGAARPLRAPARGAPRDRARRGAAPTSTSTRAGCACAAASTSCSPTSRGTRSTCRSTAPSSSSSPRTTRRSSPATSSCPRSRERWSDEPGGLARRGRSRSGATWDGSGTNFSLFSEHAERVELCLFDGDDNEERVELTERTALHLALLPAGRRAGPALRLPRPRALRARDRAIASTRPSCCSTRTRSRSTGPCAWDQANVLPYVPTGRRGRRPRARRRGRRRRRSRSAW